MSYSFVHLVGPGGLDRVLPLVDYLFWPSAALLGTRAQLITRRDAIALRALAAVR